MECVIHSIQNLLITSLISFLFTFFFVPLVAKVAFKFNVVDAPDGKLKKHERITPYLGGVALGIGFISALFLANFHEIFLFNTQIISLLVGAFFLLAVGLVDDILVIKPIQKLAGQSISTLFFLKAGLYINIHGYNFISIPISFLWFLSAINAFNLVDVMDGLATILAITSTTSFLFLALFLGKINFALFLAAFLGSLAAFFWYNKPSAKIYLGDAGSLFIGGILSAVPFFLISKSNSLNDFYIFFSSILILLIPLLELICLIIIRSYKKIPFYLGSPDHFAIYLQKKGWSKLNILFYVSVLTFILFGMSYSLIFHYISLIVSLVALTLLFSFWCFILY